MSVDDFVRLLKSAHPASEVWLDGSPTAYAGMKQQLLLRYPTARMFTDNLLPDHFAPSVAGVSGATTNPRLVTAAIVGEPNDWLPRIQALQREHDAAHIQQRVHAELIGQGAELLKALWQHSGHQQGWLSAQVDASDAYSADCMVRQGLALARVASNVMVKVPGSEAGYAAIERLVAQGCSINNTFCFSVSQVAAGVEAIRRGQATALRDGRDVSQARYVITFMIGRWGAEALLDWQAQERGICLTATDKRWAEIAIYQAIQVFLARNNSPAKLLLSSLRVDQVADGSRHCWHLEKTGGYETRYTLTPDVIEFMVQREAIGIPLQPELDTAIPFTVLHKLMQLPYFRQSCFEEAIDAADFARQPAFIRARHEACAAQRRLTDFIVTALGGQLAHWVSAWKGRLSSATSELRPGART